MLAIDFVDEPGHPTRAALDRVLSFLHERLHTYLTQDRPPSFRGRSVSISGCACQPCYTVSGIASREALVCS